VVYVHQARRTDRPQGGELVDREGYVALGLGLRLVPLDLFLYGDGQESAESPGGHEVVDPTLVELQQVAAQRAKRHEFSLDV
jgi:hypothetical protein